MVIRDVLKDAAAKNRVASDPAFAKFLYDDCASELPKILAKEYSLDKEVSPPLQALIQRTLVFVVPRGHC